MRPHNSILLALALAATAGCATATPGANTTAEQPEVRQARLDVRNRTSEDMDIFLTRGGQRVRIGTAPAGVTTGFALSAGLMTGGPAQFEAVRIRGAGAPTPNVQTELVTVRPGDVITLDVPPQ